MILCVDHYHVYSELDHKSSTVKINNWSPRLLHLQIRIIWQRSVHMGPSGSPKADRSLPSMRIGENCWSEEDETCSSCFCFCFFFQRNGESLHPHGNYTRMKISVYGSGFEHCHSAGWHKLQEFLRPSPRNFKGTMALAGGPKTFWGDRSPKISGDQRTSETKALRKYSKNVCGIIYVVVKNSEVSIL